MPNLELNLSNDDLKMIIEALNVDYIDTLDELLDIEKSIKKNGNSPEKDEWKLEVLTKLQAILDLQKRIDPTKEH